MKYKIIRNSVRCLKCGDEVESKHGHDFKFCECGAIAVDGGRNYLRRVGDFSNYQDTSITEGDEINDIDV